MEGQIASEIASIFLGAGAVSKLGKLDKIADLAKLKTAQKFGPLADNAAKTADTIAEGLRISPYRVTGPGETFIRYESANPAFTKITPGGVKPGTFAAPASDGLIPVANRVPVYNLPSPQIPRPNAITLTPPPGTPIIGPRPVVGGTGNEVIFPMGY